jgi:hypothetical protein
LRFKTIYTLNTHCMRKHNSPLFTPKAHLEESVSRTCDEKDCDFSCRTSALLVAHVKEEHPGINYACGLCRYQTPVKSLYQK